MVGFGRTGGQHVSLLAGRFARLAGVSLPALHYPGLRDIVLGVRLAVIDVAASIALIRDPAARC
jgi:hypothetical protein